MKKSIVFLLISLLCFIAAYALLGVLSDFFAAGGGVIKVKGLLAPGILFLLGVYLLYKFFSTTGLKKALSIVCVMLVMAIGIGSVVYLNSWSYRQKKITEQIRNGNISDSEAIDCITQMLYQHTASTDEAARECVDILIQRKSAWAMYQKAQWELDKGNYNEAFQYMLEAEKNLTPEDTIEADLYKSIADAYYQGKGIPTDKNIALDYYIKAFTGTLPQSDYDRERIYRIANDLNREVSEEELQYRSSALSNFYSK